MERWHEKCKSIELVVGENRVFTLYFADDQVVRAEV